MGERDNSVWPAGKMACSTERSVESHHHKARNRQTVIIKFNNNCPHIFWPQFAIWWANGVSSHTMKRVRPTSILFSFYKAAPLKRMTPQWRFRTPFVRKFAVNKNAFLNIISLLNFFWCGWNAVYKKFKITLHVHSSTSLAIAGR